MSLCPSEQGRAAFPHASHIETPAFKIWLEFPQSWGRWLFQQNASEMSERCSGGVAKPVSDSVSALAVPDTVSFVSRSWTP